RKSVAYALTRFCRTPDPRCADHSVVPPLRIGGGEPVAASCLPPLRSPGGPLGCRQNPQYGRGLLGLAHRTSPFPRSHEHALLRLRPLEPSRAGSRQLSVIPRR